MRLSISFGTTVARGYPGRAQGYSERVPALAEASLSAAERRALDHLVASLADELGARLKSVWLYGSRARGESLHPESDVDVLVIVDPELRSDLHRVVQAASDAEEAAGAKPVVLAPMVYSSERINQRRKIRSFFIQEVDRDKIVLFGEP
jgi:predicted nucleotidyltransferase